MTQTFNIEDLKYPIGEFIAPDEITNTDIKQWIEDIVQLPKNMRAAVTGLSDSQLDTPYRPDGWTLRQVVHHTADSHINAYVRFKLAMTEENPTIRPYQEALWADLQDGKLAPIEISLSLLESLHHRWVLLLKSLTMEDFATRSFFHPESRKIVYLEAAVGMYSWHGRHHTAHIVSLRERSTW